MVLGRQTIQRLSNLGWERWLNISTRGRVGVDYPDAGHYASMNYSLIHKVLRHLSLQPSDVFVDIGSGKGRVVCCAARFPIARVVGVDLSTEFCEQARVNSARSRGRRAPIVIHNMVAQEFDYSECTGYYLFSPFGPETLGEVLTKIRKDRAGRPVHIAYANPAYQSVFADHDWLDQYEFWDRETRGEEHSVAFYRTRG